MKLLKYILTPIAAYLSIAIFVNLFFFLYPYVVLFLLELRGDGGFWSIFGRWGILFISTFLGGFAISLLFLPITLIGQLVHSLSPNDNFLKYSYWITGVLYGILCLYQIWTNTPIDLYEIVSSSILSIFMVIIIIMVGFSANEN